jgi:hypothetical protein
MAAQRQKRTTTHACSRWFETIFRRTRERTHSSRSHLRGYCHRGYALFGMWTITKPDFEPNDSLISTAWMPSIPGSTSCPTRSSILDFTALVSATGAAELTKSGSSFAICLALMPTTRTPPSALVSPQAAFANTLCASSSLAGHSLQSKWASPDLDRTACLLPRWTTPVAGHNGVTRHFRG